MSATISHRTVGIELAWISARSGFFASNLALSRIERYQFQLGSYWRVICVLAHVSMNGLILTYSMEISKFISQVLAS